MFVGKRGLEQTSSNSPLPTALICEALSFTRGTMKTAFVGVAIIYH